MQKNSSDITGQTAGESESGCSCFKVTKLEQKKKRKKKSWLVQKAELSSIFQILNLEGNEALGRNAPTASAMRLEI